MNDLYMFCRELNPYLAIVALVVLGYRVAPTLFLLGRPTAVARALFGGYILLTALGSWEGQRVGNSATYVSPLITLLHVAVIVLFLVWDFGLSKGVEDHDRRRGVVKTRKDDA